MEFHAKKFDTAKSEIHDWNIYLKNTIITYLDDQAETFCEKIDKNMDEIKHILPQLSKLDDIKTNIAVIRSEIDRVTNSKDFTKMIYIENSIESFLKDINAQNMKKRTHFFKFSQSELTFPKLGDLTLTAVFDLQCTQSIETGLSCIDKMTAYTNAPQIPTALHTTRDNKVIISTVEAGRDWLPMDVQYSKYTQGLYIADSISMEGAQIPQLCHMCEENADIKFKCLDCAFLLCPRCRKLHAKVKTQYVHRIVDLKDKRAISSGIKTNRVIPNRCEFHEDEHYIMYCKSCQRLVCITCIVTMHQKHEMRDMKLIDSAEKTKLKKYEEKIDKIILPSISRKFNRCDDLMEFHAKKCETAKSKIHDWNTYLKNTIITFLDDQAETFCEKIDKNMDEIKQNILPQFSKLDDIKTNIAGVRSEIDRVTNSKDFTKMIYIENSVESFLKAVNAQNMKKRTHFFKFSESKLTIPKLGDLTFTAVFDLQCTQSIETGLSCIDKMTAYTNGELLVRNLKLKNLCLLKSENDKFIESQKWNFYVKDISVLQTGEIIVILFDKTDLRLVSTKELMSCKAIDDCTTIFFDTAPQIPTTLHTTRDNKVIISTVEAGRDLLPMDDPCKVEILVITAKSEVIFRFLFNKDLFCFPNKITSLGTDICIADSISDYSGRLVTLNNKGKVKWIYGDNETNSVIIADMVATPLNNIVLLDPCQSVLRVLDSNGAFLNTWGLRDFKITDAYAMTISNDNKIIIGCGHDGHNLHILEFME
ncbi:TRIM56 [Mytilus edulis]|uniref:TRIM56 n=1 Tax=Mytilus edulis TaxID=6550 RepID=A0A8S3S4Y5_MYTED|nr:TRIM56 [Mytilus edulis]